ncbi:DUF2203 domain-containing protein [Marinactinospora thermotolerans]|uniref:DUF2203 domain-containing protein n=1 Tax=Marinactinospora thermotolerans DSM 45154 TaxID=1122192 RepID=A0A1T4SM62_9ACTN|nr:DUF2203 domain-containing protein [Marinactinospora thermotolerans]SKA29287.1 hypothetical protein SAMN02745673_03691 [Marinactinospora thermotolerans DSM 45154]
MGHSKDDTPGPVPHQGGGDGARRLFSTAEAHALLPWVRELTDELVAVRADLVQLAADLNTGGMSPLGGMAELKALEARLAEIPAELGEAGIEVKGVAPLLLDFPVLLSGTPVRLCWLEGETEIAWYHRIDLGFAGRRPLPPTERAYPPPS